MGSKNPKSNRQYELLFKPELIDKKICSLLVYTEPNEDSKKNLGVGHSILLVYLENNEKYRFELIKNQNMKYSGPRIGKITKESVKALEHANFKQKQDVTFGDAVLIVKEYLTEYPDFSVVSNNCYHFTDHILKKISSDYNGEVKSWINRNIMRSAKYIWKNLFDKNRKNDESYILNI